MVSHDCLQGPPIACCPDKKGFTLALASGCLLPKLRTLWGPTEVSCCAQEMPVLADIEPLQSLQGAGLAPELKHQWTGKSRARDLSAVALFIHTAFASVLDFVYSLVLLYRSMENQREEDLAAGEDKYVTGCMGGHLMLLSGLKWSWFLLLSVEVAIILLSLTEVVISGQKLLSLLTKNILGTLWLVSYV